MATAMSRSGANARQQSNSTHPSHPKQEKSAVNRLIPLALLASLPWVAPVWAQEEAALIVVEDRGGVSAQPYYRAMKLPLRATQVVAPPVTSVPTPPKRRFSEADMLPVRSPQLTPGTFPRRVFDAPGLPPFFMVGDDEASRNWLRDRASALRSIHAVGLVVNVETLAALAALRVLAPGLLLLPVSADDLAARLGVRHYPALITATSIEQ
jgi:integrating conjugative element protein (TIGR03765 family)